jgi:hypothetical protein
MSVSSTSSDLPWSVKYQRHGRILALSLAAGALLAFIGASWVSYDHDRLRDPVPAVQPGKTEPAESAQPLFAGWIQPGQADFGQKRAVGTADLPRWVLATEPSEQETQALQAVLADRPDKDSELARLIDYTRFQKQVALWSELQNGPMNSERATLIQHLLDVLPAHYNRGELLGPQALLMAKALIKELEPNPQLQSERLADAKSRLEERAPTINESQLASQEAFESFQQQQKQIVSEYEAQPADQHNPLQLEARLDAAARRNLLDGPLTTVR